MAEKKIGKNTYSVTPLLASEALKLMGKIVKLVGPGLTDLTDAFKKGENESDKAAIAAIQKIIGQMDWDDSVDLMIDLCERAEIKRSEGYQTVIFDNDFTDNKDEMLGLMWFVLEENFRDFFPAVKAISKRVNKTAA